MKILTAIWVYNNYFYVFGVGVIKNSIVLHRKVQLPLAEGISRKSGTA